MGPVAIEHDRASSRVVAVEHSRVVHLAYELPTRKIT